MKSFQISKQEAGQRLDKYLHRILPIASSGFLYKMLRKKNIMLNHKKAEGKEILLQGDLVEVFFRDDTFVKFSEQEGAQRQFDSQYSQYINAYETIHPVIVLYESEDIIILSKPIGVLSQKAKENDISINEWLLGYLLSQDKITSDSLKTFKPSICNRLDRNTSGIILCSITLPGSHFLNQMLKERTMHKYYLTFVSGKITTSDHLHAYLSKNEKTNKVKIVDKISENQKELFDEIETAYQPVYYDSQNDITELEVLLITGKSHQIRAHLAFIGHPILGDYKYGGKKIETLPSHQILHAYRIVFPELTGMFSSLSLQEYRAPLPTYMNKLSHLT